jgi:hypothetical protein
MQTSRSIIVVLAAGLATAALASCASARTGSPGRTDTPNGAPASVRARVMPCAPGKPAAGALRGSALEREWLRLDDENEKPLRDIVAEGNSAKDALASLDASVLTKHNWTLTRYLVRTLHELHSNSIWEARVQLGNEDYAQQALHDALWDGSNAWDIMDGVRGETIAILVWLEKVRTSASQQAEQTRTIVSRLLDAASRLEPVTAKCKAPNDSGLK